MAVQVRISPESVESEINLLRKFCGSEQEECCLKSVTWKTDHVFSNGCRAPPWEQLQGVIGRLEVEPVDAKAFVVTVRTDGYYCGEEEVYNTETSYPTISSLLTDKSKVFYNRLKNQSVVSGSGDRSATTFTDHTTLTVSEQEMTKSTEPKAVNFEEEKKAKVVKKPGKSSEPSSKWKQLETPEHVTVKDKKDKKVPKHRNKRAKGQRSHSLKHEEGMSDSDSSSSEEEEEETLEIKQSNADLPSEYWQIQKLVKYLKGGNQTATVIALCSMRDFNLHQDTCQLAIRDVGGLEVLINLLDTSELKCKIGALKILRDISHNVPIRQAISDLGGLPPMIKILSSPSLELKCLSAETIANVTKYSRARRIVRRARGIPKLVSLLDVAFTNKDEIVEDTNPAMRVARSGALGLWSCSISAKNKKAIINAKAVPKLARLLQSDNEEVLIPVIATLQECASAPEYRQLIRSSGMIQFVVKNLNSENQELQMHCAYAIFKCAEDSVTRDVVRHYGGLEPLCKLLQFTENKQLLAAATGGIWKCSYNLENVLRFTELKAIDQLVALLTDQPEEVLINVVGALGECARLHPPVCKQLRALGGIHPLVSLLTGTNHALLINATTAVGACATDCENMVIVDKLDGVRLLWSLLKSWNPEVQASAAWAICPCIENAKDAGEMVRSFVGGLELIVGLLKSEDIGVLASVCAAIANIARDEENLAVITDHGVVPMLARLTPTNDDTLRKHLSEAIANCCMWGDNSVAFGRNGAVQPLVRYLHSPDPLVHRSTAYALNQLSANPDNCIAMHTAGVVQYLLTMVGSPDEELQEAAAGCLENIRKLALANEHARLASQ